MGWSLIHESTKLGQVHNLMTLKSYSEFLKDNIIGREELCVMSTKGFCPMALRLALKRFKNCSAAGDATFKHEGGLEGHQRIIVCDLMKNGSVYDHLFASNGPKLSWPLRHVELLFGTARGLAYLHFGGTAGNFSQGY
ncbi:hypothetical protein CUMW_278230 [Citrus unshiu]|uniref:Protein kinase domain-containing protein n=1 Tax=Citrus unshiu TaxID=55188 RepID=A0A2H5N5P4_CITUN|nr:hypothetical protein CUMW_278230 [Citrus unshiu]